MIITNDILTLIVESMKEGCTPTEVAAKLGVSKKTFNKMIRESEEVQNALDLGLTMFEARFESFGKELMTGKIQGKDAVWKMFMQKYFNWSDKAEITTNNHTDLSDAELDKLYKDLTSRQNESN